VLKRTMLALIAFVAVSCCGGKTATDETAALTGTVVIIGNEPFTSPAVQLPDGGILRVICTKETETQLRAIQGKRVRLQVSRLDAAAKEVHVTQVHVLTSEQQEGKQ
jgi:hypothetical protein